LKHSKYRKKLQKVWLELGYKKDKESLAILEIKSILQLLYYLTKNKCIQKDWLIEWCISLSTENLKRVVWSYYQRSLISSRENGIVTMDYLQTILFLIKQMNKYSKLIIILAVLVSVTYLMLRVEKVEPVSELTDKQETTRWKLNSHW
jgi:hypothetical protein